VSSLWRCAFVVVSLAILPAFVPVPPAAAYELAATGTPMPTGASARPPAGLLGFCIKNLQECIPTAEGPAEVALTPERWRDLTEVQETINTQVRPRQNESHAWEYAVGGSGDCNTFALEKRRALLARGWPRTALLLAAAITETNEGHLVLIVRTTAGDLVLDNRQAAVVEWSRLPYRWVSRQSEQRPAQWVSILARPILTSDARTAPQPVH
jgi:predicted transglutaminase-like cysteine proteinase